MLLVHFHKHCLFMIFDTGLVVELFYLLPTVLDLCKGFWLFH